MPSRSGQRKPRSRLQQDPIVEALRPDPGKGADTQPYQGLLGKSEADGQWRLYLSADLSNYLEFAAEDVVHQESAGDHPLAGSIVWLRRKANVRFVQARSQEGEAGLLAGEVS